MNVQSYKRKLLQCENTSIKLHRNLDFDWPLQQPDSFFFSHFIVDLLFHDPVGIYMSAKQAQIIAPTQPWLTFGMPCSLLFFF